MKSDIAIVTRKLFGDIKMEFGVGKMFHSLSVERIKCSLCDTDNLQANLLKTFQITDSLFGCNRNKEHLEWRDEEDKWKWKRGYY